MAQGAQPKSNGHRCVLFVRSGGITRTYVCKDAEQAKGIIANFDTNMLNGRYTFAIYNNAHNMVEDKPPPTATPSVVSEAYYLMTRMMNLIHTLVKTPHQPCYACIRGYEDLQKDLDKFRDQN